MRGHIRKRGSSWSVVIYTGRDPLTKKPKYRWHGGFRTKKEAETAMTDLLGRLERGTYVEASRQTVGEFLEEWLPVIETRGLRDSTRRSYRSFVQKQLIPRVGSVPLQRLTPGHLNAVYAEMLTDGRRDGKGGLSPRSVRYCHMILRRALADAVKWNRLPRNPADSADPPSAKSARAKVMKTWSAPELLAFLEHVRDDRLYPAFWLAALTGMRRGEVLGLRWRDLDLDRARLSVVQTLIAPDYQVQFSEPKTEKGRRSVDLDPDTVEVLRAHKKPQLEERLAFGPGYDETDLVSRQPDGRPLHPHQFSQAFEQRTKEAGLPRIRLHDLRHTYATLALQGDEHPKIVSERLGHSSISITLDIYSHAMPSLQKESAARVAALILGE